MDFFNVLILGIVEGLTEFLPVSSTAHLIIASKLMGIPQTDFIKLFEVFIQSGAILAVIFLYFKYLLKNLILIKYLFISSIPTAFAGLIFHKMIKNIFFESFGLIIFSLFFIGILFILFEILVSNKKISLKKKLSEINFLESFFIGLFQSLAIIPGVSRAGSVILGMMVLRYKREEATLYSFLLAVPTIISAGFFDLYKEREIIFADKNNFVFLILGFVISFIFAYLSVKWFINFVKKNSLIIFGIYRIIISIILFLVFL